MCIEFVDERTGIPSTDPVLGPNDHIKKCGVIRQSRVRVIFNTYTLSSSRRGRTA